MSWRRIPSRTSPVYGLGALMLSLCATPAGAESGPDGMPGEKTFRTVCQGCHLESLSANDTLAQSSSLAAPPMNLLSVFVRSRLNNDRAAFVGHVASFTRTPSADTALLPPQVIERHGLMPAAREIAPDITLEQLQAVGGWIYDHYNYKQLLPEAQRLMTHGQGTAQ